MCQHLLNTLTHWSMNLHSLIDTVWPVTKCQMRMWENDIKWYKLFCIIFSTTSSLTNTKQLLYNQLFKGVLIINGQLNQHINHTQNLDMMCWIVVVQILQNRKKRKPGIYSFMLARHLLHDFIHFWWSAQHIRWLLSLVRCFHCVPIVSSTFSVESK